MTSLKGKKLEKISGANLVSIQSFLYGARPHSYHVKSSNVVSTPMVGTEKTLTKLFEGVIKPY